MKIAKDLVASFDYVLTDAEGTVMDSSEGYGPLAYLHGHDNLIPGLESELEGKQVGDSFKVTVAPEEAYGVRDESLLIEVERSNFEHIEDLEVGMELNMENEEGEHTLVVSEIKDDVVVLDGNHPLAGMTLTFDVKVTEVREASAEELEHGHPHHEHGCGDDCDCEDEGCCK